MAEEIKTILAILAEADKVAEEKYPVGSDVTVIKTKEWGKVLGHIKDPVLGMEPRTEPVLNVSHGNRGQQLYNISEVKPYDGPKLPDSVAVKLEIKR